MRTVKLIDPSVAPGGALIVPALGNALVKYGETVEVPDELAGKAPTTGDLGHGLLAQHDIWAAADGEKTEG